MFDVDLEPKILSEPLTFLVTVQLLFRRLQGRERTEGNNNRSYLWYCAGKGWPINCWVWKFRLAKPVHCTNPNGPSRYYRFNCIDPRLFISLERPKWQLPPTNSIKRDKHKPECAYREISTCILGVSCPSFQQTKSTNFSHRDETCIWIQKELLRNKRSQW